MILGEEGGPGAAYYLLTFVKLYTPTYTQLLINCLRKENNLIIIRDFINGTLTKDLTDAIDNEVPVTIVCDAVCQQDQVGS